MPDVIDPARVARMYVNLDPAASMPYLVVVGDQLICEGDDYERVAGFVRAYNSSEHVTVLRGV